MYCPNCGSNLQSQFCSSCGLLNPNFVAETPKKKNSFWKRLGTAIVLEAQRQAAINAQQQPNGVNQNPDGSWSYRNDYSGNSIISDGEHIYFTK